jgi:fructokinase
LLELPADFPVGWDTDVNAPALAEYDMDDSISSCAYVTVGTGVGVGLVIEGHAVHGLLHGEGGHISVPRYPGDDFVGNKNLACSEEFAFDELESMCNSSALAVGN